jgi:hypothetical protein
LSGCPTSADRNRPFNPENNRLAWRSARGNFPIAMRTASTLPNG